jgi:hypothetical protein
MRDPGPKAPTELLKMQFLFYALEGYFPVNLALSPARLFRAVRRLNEAASFVMVKQNRPSYPQAPAENRFARGSGHRVS